MKILTWINKRINYTKSWRQTVIVGLTVSLVLVFVLIFLQPFDTYNFQSPIKNLLLLGYAPCIILPILVVHAFESWFYQIQKRKWFIWNEVLSVFFTCFLMITTCYFYLALAINNNKPDFSNWWNFSKNFGSPFIFILAPLWVYLRSRLGTKEKAKDIPDRPEVVISSQNKKETLKIRPQDFIYAQSQQNYVVIYYQAENGEVKKKMLRLTLSQLNDQLPTAQQVHRSYLLNLDFIQSIKGNARQRFITLKSAFDPIPFSQKYYRNLKDRLSNSSP